MTHIRFRILGIPIVTITWGSDGGDDGIASVTSQAEIADAYIDIDSATFGFGLTGGGP